MKCLAIAVLLFGIADKVLSSSLRLSQPHGLYGSGSEIKKEFELVCENADSNSNVRWRINNQNISDQFIAVSNDRRRLSLGRYILERGLDAEGTYTCSLGDQSSNPLRVYVPPRRQQLSAGPMRVSVNETIRCPLSFGSLKAQYEVHWEKASTRQELNDPERFRIDPITHELAVVEPLRDIEEVHCVATIDVVSGVTSRVESNPLAIAVFVTLVMSELSSQVVMTNSEAKFTCRCRVFPPPEYFEWCRGSDCRPSSDWTSTVPGVTAVDSSDSNDIQHSSTLTLSGVTENSTITCKVQSDGGNGSQTAKLELFDPNVTIAFSGNTAQVLLPKPIPVNYTVILQFQDGSQRTEISLQGITGVTEFTETVIIDFEDYQQVRARLEVMNEGGDLIAGEFNEAIDLHPGDQPDPDDSHQLNVTLIMCVAAAVVAIAVVCVTVCILVYLVRNKCGRKKETSPRQTEEAAPAAPCNLELRPRNSPESQTKVRVTVQTPGNTLYNYDITSHPNPNPNDDQGSIAERTSIGNCSTSSCQCSCHGSHRGYLAGSDYSRVTIDSTDSGYGPRRNSMPGMMNGEGGRRQNENELKKQQHMCHSKSSNV